MMSKSLISLILHQKILKEQVLGDATRVYVENLSEGEVGDVVTLLIHSCFCLSEARSPTKQLNVGVASEKSEAKSEKHVLDGFCWLLWDAVSKHVGFENKKVAATKINHESSRSHTIFTCIVESKWNKDSVLAVCSAKLNLVDLAGSERQGKTGAKGDRLSEAGCINKSLSTLSLVIMSLADDSFGGNSKTIIIANISPSTGQL
ncbi:hypothetical protein ACP70R_013216 [Stipagrostis hirtigluma subsp. patula]